MSLKVIPTNIGGFNLPFAQLQGPLQALFQNQNPENLIFPSDLGSNPAMGHAVMFEIFDYTSGFVEGAKQLASMVTGAIPAETTFDTAKKDLLGTVEKVGTNLGTKENLKTAAELALSAGVAATYKRKEKKKLANISLYMPDTLNITYNSSYNDVSLTESLGPKGIIANAITDSMKAYKSGGKDAVQSILANEYAAAYGSKIVGDKLGPNIGGLLQQAAGLYINPQIQLLYKGVALRTFQLNFIFTPKSSQEAQIAKDICDSFAFYSLPGLGASGGGEAGQFLIPPQLFRISFKFLGKNDILGSVSSVFSSALSNSGLGFLNTINPTNSISNGVEAKIMTVGDCVLENVNVDYAPNGWAAYNDGYPIQTTLTLQFKEMEMPTKNSIKNSKVASNYSEIMANQEMSNFNSRASQVNYSKGIDLTSSGYTSGD